MLEGTTVPAGIPALLLNPVVLLLLTARLTLLPLAVTFSTELVLLRARCSSSFMLGKQTVLMGALFRAESSEGVLPTSSKTGARGAASAEETEVDR